MSTPWRSATNPPSCQIPLFEADGDQSEFGATPLLTKLGGGGGTYLGDVVISKFRAERSRARLARQQRPPTHMNSPQDSGFKIVRRLGPHPHANDQKTTSLNGCPDLFEGSDKNFYVIGRDRTEELRAKLPSDASCGPDERIIEVPRRTIVLAKPDIPDSV